jgi:hypothetical protein
MEKYGNLLKISFIFSFWAKIYVVQLTLNSCSSWVAGTIGVQPSYGAKDILNEVGAWNIYQKVANLK